MGLGNVFFTAANAVLPILLLILVGYVLKNIGWLGKDFVKTGNKLVFNVFLPVMLFVNVYNIDGLGSIQWDVVIYSCIVICLLFVIGYFVAIFTTKVPERRGVLMQSLYRSNYAIIGLPLAGALGGEQALAVTSILSAFAIPFFTLFSVISLTMFLHGQKQEKKGLLKDIFLNPMLLGVAAGLVALGIRQLQNSLFGEVVFSLNTDLKFLFTALDNLRGLTSPFALIIMGAQFEFSAVKSLFKEIVAGTLGRIVLAPLIGIGLAFVLSTYTDILSCGPNEYPALIARLVSAISTALPSLATRCEPNCLLSLRNLWI